MSISNKHMNHLIKDLDFNDSCVKQTLKDYKYFLNGSEWYSINSAGILLNEEGFVQECRCGDLIYNDRWVTEEEQEKYIETEEHSD